MDATAPPDAVERLLFVLSRGWLEARANSERAEQIFDLADAMHNIPVYIAHPSDGLWSAVRRDLRRYHEKWPTTVDYMKYLDGANPGW
jgi:hypothetical protein